MKLRSAQASVVAVAVLVFGLFSGFARADHSVCHTFVGGPACHFGQLDAQERGEMQASAEEDGVRVSVEVIETPTWLWFRAWIYYSDGTVHQVDGHPDVFSLDPLLRSGRLQTSFEIDGSSYELVVELHGEEDIQRYTSVAILHLYRDASGRLSLSRDSQEILDLPAGGRLSRFASARFGGGGGGGCLGPIC